MAHFVELDDDNTVIRMLVVPDDEEHRGEEFLAVDLGLGGRWIQTSITNRIRGVFAIPGMKYIPEVDKFMPLKPATNPSYIFDETAWTWVCPVAEPDDADWVIGGNKQPEFEESEIEADGQLYKLRTPFLPENPKIYVWNEDTISWDLLPPPPSLEV